MKTKTIIIFLVFLAFATLFVFGYTKSGNNNATVLEVSTKDTKNALVATSTMYDFGTISMKNGNVSRDFTLTNSASKDITIIGVETSCMCTIALLMGSDGSMKGPFGMPGMGAGMTKTNEIIRAGESRMLKVVYDPNAHGPAGVGAINRLVTVTDSYGNTLKFEIKAVVTP